MSRSHVVELHGCTPEPLMSYLKALGILRLVSEQVDPTTLGRWSQDRFVLESLLSREGLVDFFLKDYTPTPILGPWAGGSGFFGNDNRVAVRAINTSSSVRLAPYREAIESIQCILEDEGITEKPSKDAKSLLLRRYRREMPDAFISWMDAVMALGKDNEPGFPFWPPGHQRSYIQPPPLEPFLWFFHPERLQRPRKGPTLLLRVRKSLEVPHFKQFLRHLSVPFPPSPGLVPLRRRTLSGWHRQTLNPPHHASKQAPRQMALGQHQPVVTGMLHQPPARLHEPLLQARQRPVVDPLR